MLRFGSLFFLAAAACSFTGCKGDKSEKVTATTVNSATEGMASGIASANAAHNAEAEHPGVPEASFTDPSNKWVDFGPYTFSQNINGIRVASSAKGSFQLRTEGGKILADIKLRTGLGDFQEKFDAVVKTLPVPRDNCANRGQTNIVADVQSASLTYDSANAGLRVQVLGHADAWSCLDNPVPETVISMETRCTPPPIRICADVPVTTLRPGRPIKSILAGEGVRAAATFVPAVVSNGQGLAFSVTAVDARPRGDIGRFLDDTWRNFFHGPGLEGLVSTSLQDLVGGGKVLASLPEDLRRYNPVIRSATIIQDGEGLAVLIELSGSADPKDVLPPPK